ncbi:MAG: FkbM family methyltransferase [Thermosphaera sp.]
MKTETLGQVVDELGLSEIDLIKIDVEGAELDVFKSASKTLEENNVFLAIAAYHTLKSVQEVFRYPQEKVFEHSHYFNMCIPSNRTTITNIAYSSACTLEFLNLSVDMRFHFIIFLIMKV